MLESAQKADRVRRIGKSKIRAKVDRNNNRPK